MSLSDDVSKARRWIFPVGTTIAALNFLVVHCDPNSQPSTNNSQLPNTGFSLKDTGGSVFLFDKLANGGSLLNSVTYGIQAVDFSIGRYPDGSTNWILLSPSPRAGSANPPILGSLAQLKVNEWMPVPASGEDWFEIYNGNITLPVAIGGLFLTDDLGNRTKYQIPPLSFIGVGLYGFQRFWADNSTASGPDHTNFKLNNSGESIGISTSASTLINGITFGALPAGVSEGRLPDGDTNIVQFPASATPGESNFLPLDNVVVNEILSHSTDPLEDAIELRNLTGSPVDISGWYLSDAKHYLTKYRIPNNTIIAADGFTVFYEYQFNSMPNDIQSFSLNSARGDQVYLSVANSNGVLTGYRSEAKFGAADLGVSIGRYESSIGPQFVALSQRTFGVDTPDSLDEFRMGHGLSNAYPRVGPVVISEIMYHPPDVGGVDDVLDEFIELHNISNLEAPLYHPSYPSNTWHLRQAVKFDFPQGASMSPGAYLLLVSFDPIADTNSLNAFRTHYSLSASVPLFGPYTGKLNNASDSVELYRPDVPQAPPDPDAGYVPYVLVDRVEYSDSAPWPGGTDGSGNSLQRVVDANFGNDPVNWTAAAPTPGPAAGIADRDHDGMPDQWEIDHNLNPDDPNDAFTDADGDGMSNLDEYLAGTDPQNPSSNLKLLIVGTNPTVLQFTAMPNKAYRIEHRDTLDASSTWLTLINLAAQPNSQVIQIQDATPHTNQFYRVIIP